MDDLASLTVYSPPVATVAYFTHFDKRRGNPCYTDIIYLCSGILFGFYLMEMLPIIIKAGIMKKSSAITSINSKTSFVKKILRKFLKSQSSKATKKENAIRNGSLFAANYELIAWSS